MAASATAAACNLGISSNFKLINSHSNFKTLRCPGISSPLLRLRGRSILPEAKSVRSYHLDYKPFILRCSLSSGNQEVIEMETAKPNVPDSTKVEALLTAICDTTSIAEFKLDLPGFQLHVKRGLVDKSMPLPVQSFPSDQTLSQIPESNGSAIVVSKPKPSVSGIQTIVETASDEGLSILQSPKVGFFRRSRTIKGKRAPPSCKEKQAVKEGQVLCYIEQLGGEIPVESDVSGEVIKILKEDGEPVGYGDALIAVLPSFPGIKKLQ